MKKLLMLLIAISPIASFAEGDITLKITNQTDLTSTVRAKYNATVDSYSCTKLVRDGWSFKRIPISTEETFEINNGVVFVPESIKSKCNYERVGGAHINFEVEGQAISYNEISVFYGGGRLDDQSVECRVIRTGPTGREEDMVACYGDVDTTYDGEAVIVVIKE